MKKIFLSLIALLSFSLAVAQTAQETTIGYEGLTIPAYTITMSQEKSMVQDAVMQRLKEAGVKTDKMNGYIVVKNQTFTDIHSQPVDFFIKVSEQGRRSNKTTEVVCFAKSPNLTISQADLNLNVKHFVETFYNYVQRYDAQKKMNAEEKNLQKAQKNQEKAVAAVASIDKDIASQQEKIAKKEAEIEKLQLKIEALRNEIAEIQGKIEKSQDKKSQAEEKVNRANEAVQSSESEVERYRQQVTPSAPSAQ